MNGLEASGLLALIGFAIAMPLHWATVADETDPRKKRRNFCIWVCVMVLFFAPLITRLFLIAWLS